VVTIAAAASPSAAMAIAQPPRSASRPDAHRDPPARRRRDDGHHVAHHAGRRDHHRSVGAGSHQPPGACTVYHVENRSLVWQSLDGGSRRHLASLDAALTPSPGPFSSTKSNSDGTLLVWTWMADDASGVQHRGTLVLSLDRAEYRSSDDSWHNVALLDE
jgi:hypothetical protein